jgi:CheY-like chemotaxis protein
LCHVLVIEDELLIATHIQTVLEENGATSVEIAATEHEAVRAALTRRPGVITSDLKLAEGNGLKAVRAIHEQAGPIPVIFITSTPKLCDMAGPHIRVLGKPVAEASIKNAFVEVRPA